MKDIDDYRKADGSVNWNALRTAEVACGDRCARCGAGILFPKGSRTICVSCLNLDHDAQEVDHDDLIRCPRCQYLDRISDWDCDYGAEKYEDGPHTVTCGNCEHEFEIVTHVSYSYTSPAIDRAVKE